MLEKEIQDRTHDLDMRALEAQKSKNRANDDVSKPIVSHRSVGVNTPQPDGTAGQHTTSKQEQAVAFNMLMRLVQRGR